MTLSTNESITYQEAQQLFKSKGMAYPKTDHNRKMMKKVVDDFLMSLRNGK